MMRAVASRTTEAWCGLKKAKVSSAATAAARQTMSGTNFASGSRLTPFRNSRRPSMGWKYAAVPKPIALVTAPFRGPGLDQLRDLAEVVLDPWIEHNPMRLYGPDDLAARIDAE